MQAGGDHLNDGIRRLLIENGLQRASIRALQTHSGGDERALTAVCFAVAMILRGGEKWRETIKWRAARSALPKTIFAADKVRPLLTILRPERLSFLLLGCALFGSLSCRWGKEAHGEEEQHEAMPSRMCSAAATFLSECQMQAYRQRCSSMGIPQDEALAALLAFLVLYLEPVQKRMRARRQLLKRFLEWTCAASLSTAVVTLSSRMLGARHA